MNNQGFINTEIGCFPKGWSIICLGDYIVDINDGPFGSNLKTEHYTSKREVRIIQLGNVGDNGWNNDNVKYTTYEHAATLKRCIVPYGSVIIAKMMPAGRAILCPSSEPMYIQGSDVIKVSFSDAISKEFFIYLTKSKAYIDQIESSVQGSTRARTNIGKIKTLKLPLPPREEQDRIADALSSMDALIASLDEVIQKKRQIKEGLMQTFFTGRKCLSGSVEWKESTLGYLADICKGVQFDTDLFTEGGKYPMLNGGITPSGYSEYYNTEAETITISEGGNSCGYVNYMTEKFWCGGHCYSLKVHSSVDKLFLYQLLKFNEKAIMALRVGSGLPNVQGKVLSKFPLKYPASIKEQRAISEILNKADQEIMALESQRDKYALIKQGMMQELLTGKTRL